MVQLRFISVAVVAGLLIQLAICQFNPINTCPYAWAPDGTKYDLSYVKQYYYVNQNGQQLAYNVSICFPQASGCGSCYQQYSTGICQIDDDGNDVCVGNYGKCGVYGFNGGAGVQITYSEGDYCEECNPPGPWQSIITLKCSNSVADDKKIHWTSVTGGSPGVPPIIYFNGTIRCHYISTSVSVPVKPPQVFKPHVAIQYFGNSPDCSLSSVFKVTVNHTVSCTPGCQKIGGTSVMTACDTDLNLPAGDHWIAQFDDRNSYSCDNPLHAIYTKQNYCTGDLYFSYQKCDANTVYWYSCETADCKQCSLNTKIATNYCNVESGATMFQCITANSAAAEPLI